MKLIKFNILIFLLIASMTGFSQAIKLKELKIGDTIPNFTISTILGYNRPNLKIADLRGKILIIDFWATWCIPCVKAMPILNQLQKEFNDDVFILPVSNQSKGEITKAFANLPTLKNIDLPFVYDDITFTKLFPHAGLPHEVIIDGKGIVQAITYADNVNSETIRKLLKNENINLAIKKSGDSFNFEKPLFIDSIGKSLMLSYGIFTKSYDGLLSRTSITGNRTDGYTRVHGTDIDLINIYKIALLKKLAATTMPMNQILLNVKDSAKFLYFPVRGNIQQKIDYMNNNTYCFDFYSAVKSKKDVFDNLKDYLDNYFNIDSKLDSVERDCFVIKSIDKSKYRSKGGEYLQDMASNFTLKNGSLSTLIMRLDVRSDTPIVADNEQLSKEKIDISIIPYHNNLKKLNEEFNKYGLNLVHEKRVLRVLVLKDRAN